MEWISVEDRLPDDCQDFYLVLVDDGDPGWFGIPKVTLWLVGAEWAETGELCDPYFEIEYVEGDPVTHWMPLPDDPKP